jgi:hypothetical protein
VDTTAPTVVFTSPTPEDNAWINQNYFTAKAEVTEANLSGLTFGCQTGKNNVNNSLYDDSLILMYNFDKVDSLGETATLVKDLSKYGRDATVNAATWGNTGKW